LQLLQWAVVVVVEVAAQEAAALGIKIITQLLRGVLTP
jgi:hypothetical protein